MTDLTNPFPTKLVTPIINLNGTDGIALFRQVDAICKGLHETRLAMGAAMPHGRDYQTYGYGAGMAAREAHTDRAVVLDAIEKDYLKLREDLYVSLSERGEWNYERAMGQKEKI